MTGLWLPLAATVLATALTYVCCIRAMRKQGGGCTPPPPQPPQGVEEEIHRMREELRLLHEQTSAPQRGDR
ncbi:MULTISPECIES: hypothetical protein [Streptomyces]|uniref:hypothetical protein n=1 Tax=Streptomyces TaxID=1883 RepID=UPI0022564314|nr:MULTISPECIES: hypothetical protein [Streptomyces]MCX5275322.1 hypothetical protein [Streptomyces virginiae]MCX5582932.1 hypothetical protein [Streptomyces erythrochromogenes]